MKSCFSAARRSCSGFAESSRESIRKHRCPISGKNSISSLFIASVFTGSHRTNGRNGLRPIGNFSSTIFERGSSNHADACSLKLIHGRTVLHFLRQSCGPSLNRKVRGFFAAKPCSPQTKANAHVSSRFKIHHEDHREHEEGTETDFLNS